MARRLLDRRKNWRLVGLTVFVGGLVFLGWSCSQLAGQERIFESSATLHVAQPAGLDGGGSKRVFLEHEMRKITSDEVLQPVVEGLGLDAQWALTSEQSILMLRGLVAVSHLAERGQNYRIHIAVRSPDGELARNIAMRIATEYQGQGNTKARIAFEREMEALDYEIAEQKRLVDDKRLEVEKAHRAARRKLREAHLSSQEADVNSEDVLQSQKLRRMID